MQQGYGRREAVEHLLAMGANVLARDDGGLIPLHNACSFGHAEVVALLLQAGADPNAKDSWSYTPLHEAADLGHVEFAKSLINNGADKNATNNELDTPLHLAVDNNQPKMVKMLTKCAEIDINVKDIDGETALEIALVKMNLDIGKLLAYSGMK